MTMKWNGKYINELDDTVLLLAKTRLQEIKDKYDARVLERQKRHENVEFVVNPTYSALYDEVQEEITKRGI